MSSENIKTAVQEKYGAAAKRAASSQGTACCGTSPSSAIEGCDPITSNLYAKARPVPYPKLPCVPRSAVAIQQRLRNWSPEKSSLISGPAGASTFCFRRAVLAPRERHTVLT